jgi:hypothetical protein
VTGEEIRVEFIRDDDPDFVPAPDDAGPPFTDTHESTELRFDVSECERVLSEVHDEVERIRSRHRRVDSVVVDVARYARLWAIVAKDTHRHARPSKESVESYIGVDVTVVEADDVVEAVAEDPDWVLSNFAFDDGGEEVPKHAEAPDGTCPFCGGGHIGNFCPSKDSGGEE